MWVKSKKIKEILELSDQALYERRKKNKIRTKIINGITFYWLEQEFDKNILE